MNKMDARTSRTPILSSLLSSFLRPDYQFRIFLKSYSSGFGR